jgi:hypothetical protein
VKWWEAGKDFIKRRCSLFVSCARCYLDDQIKENGLYGACSTHGKMRNAYSILVGKPEGKKPLHSEE